MPTLTCTRCNTELERSEFKRLATLAQSRAWTKNPLATKRITYIGKICIAHTDGSHVHALVRLPFCVERKHVFFD